MANISIPFTTPGNYTYDSSKIEVTGGLGKLKSFSIAATEVSQFKLNDNAASTTVIDSIGGHNGIANTNTNNWSQVGLIGQALQNTTTDYINGGSGAHWDGIATGSISFWMRPTGGYIAGDGYESFYTFYTNNSRRTMVYLSDVTGKITFDFLSTIGSAGITSNANTWSDQWYWIYVEWGTGGMKMYVDNVLQASTNPLAAGLGHLSGSSTLYLFTDNFSGAKVDNFIGKLDDFRIFNGQLTSTERSLIYNAGVGTENILFYPSDNPNIILTAGNPAPNVVNWTNFVITTGTVEGSIGYQLSNDGITYYYWNGSVWTIATTQVNTEATVNTNISTFTTTGSKIYVKSVLISNAYQRVEIDQIDISFVDNIAPSLDAGTNKTAVLFETIKPFSDCTFSDADGTVDMAEYKVIGEVDVWTEIPQGVFGTLLEAVQDFSYQYNNIGSLSTQLRVTDNVGATTEDSLTVTVAKKTITITIFDASTGLQLSAVDFTPGDSTPAFSIDSGDTYDYGLGVFSATFSKTDYFPVLQDLTVLTSTTEFIINMTPSTGTTELVEEINIDINSDGQNINLEVE